MRIKNIVTERFTENWPSYHLIYEWEDVLASILKVPIVDIRLSQPNSFANRYIRRLATSRLGWVFKYLANVANGFLNSANDEKSLVFELSVNNHESFANSGKAVPVIVDFWKQIDLPAFYQSYRNVKLVLVSSLEVVHYLHAQQCPLNIKHFPLSLSDTYQLKADSYYPKKYDILFAGRGNTVLMEFMHRFVAKFPETEFLQQQEIEGELYYVSNKQGLIGKFHSRAEYMELLRASKISFYSTPGIDGGEKRTGGFNPVTPRYLELLSAQCLLLGRYPDNAETNFYELNRVCPNIRNYEEFEKTMLGYLQQKNPDFEFYNEILNKHYTSCRAKQLAEMLINQ